MSDLVLLAGGGDTQFSAVPGIPKREDYMKVYCAHTGVPYPIQDWQFYLALAYFRAASICEVSSNMRVK